MVAGQGLKEEEHPWKIAYSNEKIWLWQSSGTQGSTGGTTVQERARFLRFLTKQGQATIWFHCTSLQRLRT
eukprot:2936632-Prorocentrum_lima.AAC.1